MKTRSGFVSNSSSSSFILAYGLVSQNNIEKVKNYLSENGIEYIPVKWNDKFVYADVKLFEQSLDKADRILTGGNDTELIVPREIAESYTFNIITVELTNNEGDDAFHDEIYSDSLDYRKAQNKSWYPIKQQKLIELFESHPELIQYGKVVYGAERNG